MFLHLCCSKPLLPGRVVGPVALPRCRRTPGVLRRPGVSGVPRQHGGAMEGAQRQWLGDEVGGLVAWKMRRGWECDCTILRIYIYIYGHIYIICIYIYMVIYITNIYM